MRALLEQDGDVFMIVSEEIFEVNFVGMRIAVGGRDGRGARARHRAPRGRARTRRSPSTTEHAARGVDPEWHKAPAFLVPLRPAARRGRPAASTARRSTRRSRSAASPPTPTAAVLDATGRPIPGLFAAGRTTAGIAAGGYVSGISLGDGSFFGRRAGRAAAG